MPPLLCKCTAAKVKLVVFGERAETAPAPNYFFFPMMYNNSLNIETIPSLS